MNRLFPRAKTIVWSSGETDAHRGFLGFSNSGSSVTLPPARSYSKNTDFLSPSSSSPSAWSPPRRCCGSSRSASAGSPRFSPLEVVVRAGGFAFTPGISASFGTSTSSSSVVSFLITLMVLIGRCCASSGTSVAEVSIAAILALSKSGVFVFFSRIDQEVAFPVAGLVAVPEPIARLEPVRLDAEIEHDLVDLRRGPLRCEHVVRRLSGLRGAGGPKVGMSRLEQGDEHCERHRERQRPGGWSNAVDHRRPPDK